MRLILLLAVLALGADAVLNDGAYTKAAWSKLSSIEIDAGDDKLTIGERKG